MMIGLIRGHWAFIFEDEYKVLTKRPTDRPTDRLLITLP